VVLEVNHADPPHPLALCARAASGSVAAAPSPAKKARRRISHASDPLYRQQPIGATGGRDQVVPIEHVIGRGGEFCTRASRRGYRVPLILNG
jgi:hypothetical protein